MGWEWESGGGWVCLRAGFTYRQLLQSFLISSLTVYYIVRTQKEFLTVCLYEVMNLFISSFPEAPVISFLCLRMLSSSSTSQNFAVMKSSGLEMEILSANLTLPFATMYSAPLHLRLLLKDGETNSSHFVGIKIY